MKKVAITNDVNGWLPDISDFIKLIENGTKFNYTRYQHGESDVISETYKDNIQSFYDDFNNKNFEKISSLVKTHPTQIHWNGLSDNFVKHMSIMWEVLYHKENLIPSLMLGVSSGVGFGKVFGEGSHNDAFQKRRDEILKFLVGNSNNIYHGGISRHMGVMNETYDLFSKLNEMEVNVVMFGPSHLKLFENEFNINKFHHIEIPFKNAVDSLDETIPKVIELSSKLSNSIIFNSTGHLISANLVYHLKDTNISSFDFGKGFDWNLRNRNDFKNEFRGVWLSAANELQLQNYIKKLRNG